MTKNDRGHTAESPREIPFAGWKDIGKRVFSQISKDNVQIVSAGVAFYFFLALFPTVIAAMTIYSLIFDPTQIQDHFASLNRFIPTEAFEIIKGIVDPIFEESDQSLGWGMVLSILLSLWSANKGTSALFTGINIAYDEVEGRGYIKKTMITLAFTVGIIVIGLLSLGIIILYPTIIESLNLPSTLNGILDVGRWVLMGAILLFSLGIIYKIAPNRRNPKFRWVSLGSIISAVLWIGGSLLFAWYVENFGSYGDVYGSLAAVIILLLWFFLTAFIVLLGAEINSEMEHQTRKDSTIGEDLPIGERNAYHANHVAGKDLEDEKE